jgi:hypothetical protein
VDDVAFLGESDEKVLGFDVSVDVVFGVEPLEALEELVGEDEGGFEGEFLAAHQV